LTIWQMPETDLAHASQSKRWRVQQTADVAVSESRKGIVCGTCLSAMRHNDRMVHLFVHCRRRKVVHALMISCSTRNCGETTPASFSLQGLVLVLYSQRPLLCSFVLVCNGQILLLVVSIV